VGNECRPRFRGYLVLLAVLGVFLVGLASQRAIAQTEKASVSGRVTDQSNAAIADAEVQIKNTDTGRRHDSEDKWGGLVRLAVAEPRQLPHDRKQDGVSNNISYGYDAQRAGKPFPQFHIAGRIHGGVSYGTAESGADLIQTTSSNLGTVIAQKAIHELPLSGRNFSQLLTLTPGATPISTSQSSTVGVKRSRQSRRAYRKHRPTGNPRPVQPVQLIFIGWCD